MKIKTSQLIMINILLFPLQKVRRIGPPISEYSFPSAIKMEASYVPNNPQFGLQLECNWSAPSNQLQQVRVSIGNNVFLYM